MQNENCCGRQKNAGERKSEDVQPVEFDKIDDFVDARIFGLGACTRHPAALLPHLGRRAVRTCSPVPR